jgi:hypothetical protein
MKGICIALACLLMVSVPLGAFGQRGGMRQGPPPQRSATAGRPSSIREGQGGFNFNRDVNASRPQPNRPSANNQNNRPNASNQNNRPNANNNNHNNNNHNNTNYNRNNTNYNHNNTNYNRNNVNVNNVHVNNTSVNRVVVVNPVYRGPAWGWNHGVAWYPAPSYWGGGFWGSLAIAATSAAVFGAIVNSQNQRIYSYQVQPQSPGATLLSNYGLTQTPCGPPNLVVIYGPNNSVICAYPNNLVSAGNYNLDTSTLSLTSQ